LQERAEPKGRVEPYDRSTSNDRFRDRADRQALASADAEPKVNPDPMPAPYDESNEGLKQIRDVKVSSLPPAGPLPEDVAAARYEGLPTTVHGLGMTRGWMESAFCWDAPAMYFKPLYFEDVNLERYGQHFDGFQPFVSFWKFYTTIVFLPLDLIAQPPCDCVYTLGYERPSNCIPLRCYKPAWLGCSLPWDRNCCKCPIGPACPFSTDDEVCRDPGL
jgi:hypothetical protein